jgi:uncharacterized membrane-anchored protein YhcB (DUF1043 family)
MTPFTLDQWIVAGLVFLLGLLVGMFVMAGGKWKRLYREEATRTRDLEAENNRLRADAREMESLRNAAAKAPPPHHVDEVPVDRRDVDRV